MTKFRFRTTISIAALHKHEPPPDPPVDQDAVATVWSVDRSRFCEIFFAHGAYKFAGYQLSYDAASGDTWSPMHHAFASFFDTIANARHAAEDFLQDK